MTLQSTAPPLPPIPPGQQDAPGLLHSLCPKYELPQKPFPESDMNSDAC